MRRAARGASAGLLAGAAAWGAACGAPPEPPPAAPVVVIAAPATPAPPPPPRPPNVGPHGETAAISGVDVEIALPGGGARRIDGATLHPPAGDRALLGIAPTTLLYLDDGTLLVGMGDGTVTAVGDDGGPRGWLGFRGAIRGLVPVTAGGTPAPAVTAGGTPAPPERDGLVVVTTDLGVMALASGAGALRWETAITGERLGPAVVTAGGAILAASRRGVFARSREGKHLFSHAASLPDGPRIEVEGDAVRVGSGPGAVRFHLGDEHPPVADQAPVFPLTFRPVLEGSFLSVVAAGPSEVWALARRRISTEEEEIPELAYAYEVVRVEGERVTRFPVPRSAARKEVFLEGISPEQGRIVVDGLALSPEGNPWLLGRRHSFQGHCDGLCDAGPDAAQILEIRGGKVQEQNALFAVFAAHKTTGRPIAAAAGGPVNLLCFGAPNAGHLCAAGIGPTFAPAQWVASVSRIDGVEWVLEANGDLTRADGRSFTHVAGPPRQEGAGERHVRAVGGASEHDVWADVGDPAFLQHFDGQRWTAVPVPAAAAAAEGFAVRAADDVWRGRMHWDGKRWSIVSGMPRAVAVLPRGPAEVWVAGNGLWRGTWEKRGQLPLEQLTSPNLKALTAPEPLPLGPPETRYAVERRRIAVRGDAPLTAAKNVAAGRDDVLWLEAWDRVVELDGEAATVIRRGGRKSFARGAQPEWKGHGTILVRDESLGADERDEIRRVVDGRVGRAQAQLDHDDAIAVHSAHRTTWIVRGASIDELTPHAWARADRDGGPPIDPPDDAELFPVLGIPPAAYCDVAVAPDGGAWFAGALSAGPAGEGILVHAAGPLGFSGVFRYRAAATLLAVSAAGPDEAWAAGAAGTVVHVRGAEVTRYTLPSGEWLRSVLALAPDDVWMCGDAGTLLHHDGHAFRPVPHPLDPHAALTGLAASKGAVWAVGPAGILRIAPRR